ncbi:MAG TPA: SRPBCC domain-containing protein [Candidatus Dormibacteraeota bacterium]|nr:SRPBCC domain-containing protein [Candidatus Dormibacteraeota bacterium]
MIEPLRLSFVVACPADHAFTTWTQKASAWWPAEHTVSGDKGMEIVFEPRAGGRIFERTTDGREIEWGEITEWDPPRRLGYRWHIATDPVNATDVEIAFLELPDASTRVEIEHGGWDRLGDRGPSWRDANQGGWDGVMPAYLVACAG